VWEDGEEGLGCYEGVHGGCGEEVEGEFEIEVVRGGEFEGCIYCISEAPD